MANETTDLATNDKAYLLAKNPAAMFVCWGWSRSRIEAFETGVYLCDITVKLICMDDKTVFVEAQAPWGSKKLYLKPPLEGKVYSAFIYARRKDGELEKLLETNTMTAPVSGPSGGFAYGYSSPEFFKGDRV